MGQPVRKPARASHWDAAYRDHGSAGVSWFQVEPTVSLELIRAAHVPRSCAVVDVGGGASVLVDRLLGAGYTDVTVLDVSSVALGEARGRLGPDAPACWVHGDVLEWRPSRPYGLWHDRAVFHFLTGRAERDVYLSTLADALEPGGVVILGTFAQDGPHHCSGLPVARYSVDSLVAVLGTAFTVVEARRELHLTPWGAEQPFTWVAARRS
jgi:SAM-dependent methyltransferase